MPISHDLDLSTMDATGLRKPFMLLLWLMLRLMRRLRWIFLLHPLLYLLHLIHLHFLPLLLLDHHLLHLIGTSDSFSASILCFLIINRCIAIIKRMCVSKITILEWLSLSKLRFFEFWDLSFLLHHSSHFFFFNVVAYVLVFVFIFLVVLHLYFGVVCLNLSWFVIL